MKPVPLEIKAQQSNLKIVWSDKHVGTYQMRNLRLACRCAACVDEWSHDSLIHPDQISPDVRLDKIDVVGNYALHFTWSDGHNTGIYSYDSLRALCECSECHQRAGSAK